MKRIVLFLGSIVGMLALAHAAPPVAEAPINRVGTPVTVSIDETNLTRVPTSQTSGRAGIFFAVPSGNTGDIVGFFGNCTSTALASTISPVQFIRGSSSSLIPLREDVCLWLITTHSANEDVHYQEVMQ